MLLVMTMMVFEKSTVRPWPVGESTVVEHLEQDVGDVGVGLLHLVEEHHRIGPSPNRLGETPALFVPHVSRRRTDQSRDRVLLHVLAHVDADHRLLGVEEERRQRLAEFGLAHSGGTEEEERSDRTVRLAQASPTSPDGLAHRPDRR